MCEGHCSFSNEISAFFWIFFWGFCSSIFSVDFSFFLMTWNALLFASREPNVFYTAEYEIQMEEPAVEIKDYDERGELLGDHALLYLLFLVSPWRFAAENSWQL